MTGLTGRTRRAAIRLVLVALFVGGCAGGPILANPPVARSRRWPV